MEWGEGFTCVTGETGAGKSVLLGALNLLAGGRADKSLIRSGADACTVEAQLFFKEAAPLDAVLEVFGLPLCEDGVLLLRRTLSREKAARIYINGSLSTRAVLQQIGELWIDFHGPGEHQQLFKESYQLKLLDMYADHQPLWDEYTQVYQQWRALGEKIQTLRTAETLSLDEQDYLRKQIELIDAVNPEDAEIEKLEQQFQRISNQQALLDYARALDEGIAGDEGALPALYALQSKAHALGGILTDAQELAARLQSIVIELEDIGGEYAALLQEDVLDEASAMEVQERMSAWLDLKRRYGAPEQVRAKRADLADKLASQGDVEGMLEALQAEQSAVEKKALALANKLHKSREKAGTALCQRVCDLLKLLGFKSAKITMTHVSRDLLHEYGMHKPQMFFEPNPGSPPQPLSKIASSGEAARVMLAIKAALADREATPVLVFDEVDANVGGEVGVEVGRELAKLGEKHQVLCITHLPQVACQAASHIRIVKASTEKQTQVRIERLDAKGSERVDELARMLGDRRSKTAQKHAEDLLAQFRTLLTE